MFWSGDGLSRRSLAGQPFAVLGKRNLARRCSRALGVFDHLRLAAFHHGHAAVCRAQIDSDNFGHICPQIPKKVSSPEQPVLLRHANAIRGARSEEHTSELQSLMRISYAVFCLKKKNKNTTTITPNK